MARPTTEFWRRCAHSIAHRHPFAAMQPCSARVSCLTAAVCRAASLLLAAVRAAAPVASRTPRQALAAAVTGCVCWYPLDRRTQPVWLFESGLTPPCGRYFTHRPSTCTARAAGGSTGGNYASSGRGALVETAREDSSLVVSQAARHAWRRRSGSDSECSGLPGEGSVCSAHTHLAG